MKYRATATMETTWEVEFDSSDIEDGDTPEQAAEEWLLAVPLDARGEGELDVEVEELS